MGITTKEVITVVTPAADAVILKKIFGSRMQYLT